MQEQRNIVRRDFIKTCALLTSAALCTPDVLLAGSDNSTTLVSSLDFLDQQVDDPIKQIERIKRYARILVATAESTASREAIMKQIDEVRAVAMAPQVPDITAKDFAVFTQTISPLLSETRASALDLENNALGLASSLFGKAVIQSGKASALNVLSLISNPSPFEITDKTSQLRLKMFGRDPLSAMSDEMVSLRRLAESRISKLNDLCSTNNLDRLLDDHRFTDAIDSLGLTRSAKALDKMAQSSAVLNRFLQQNLHKNLLNDDGVKQAMDFAQKAFASGFAKCWSTKNVSLLFQKVGLPVDFRNLPKIDSRFFDPEGLKSMGDAVSLMSGISNALGDRKLASNINRVGNAATSLIAACALGNPLAIGSACVNFSSVFGGSEGSPMAGVLASINHTLDTILSEMRYSFAKIEAQLDFISSQLSKLTQDLYKFRIDVDSRLEQIAKMQEELFIYLVGEGQAIIRGDIANLLRESLAIMSDTREPNIDKINAALLKFTSWAIDYSARPSLTANGMDRTMIQEMSMRKDISSLVGLLPKALSISAPNSKVSSRYPAGYFVNHPHHWAAATQGFLELCSSQKISPLDSSQALHESAIDCMGQLERQGEKISQFFNALVQPEVLNICATGWKEAAKGWGPLVAQAANSVMKTQLGNDKSLWMTGGVAHHTVKDTAVTGRGKGGAEQYVSFGNKGYYALQKFDLGLYQGIRGSKADFVLIDSDPFILCQRLRLVNPKEVRPGANPSRSSRGTQAVYWDTWQNCGFELNSSLWIDESAAREAAKLLEGIQQEIHRLHKFDGRGGEAWFFAFQGTRYPTWKREQAQLTDDLDYCLSVFRQITESYLVDCQKRIIQIFSENIKNADKKKLVDDYDTLCAANRLTSAMAWWYATDCLPLANRLLADSGVDFIFRTDDLVNKFVGLNGSIPLAVLSAAIPHMSGNCDSLRQFVEASGNQGSQLTTSIDLPKGFDLSDLYAALAIASCEITAESVFDISNFKATDGFGCIEFTLQTLRTYKNLCTKV